MTREERVDKIIEGLSLKDYESPEETFEMAKIWKDDSGLPYVIWLDDRGKERNVPHNLPRLKVEVDKNNMIPVLIDKVNPRILVKGKTIKKFKLIKNWIIDNYQLLIDHWNLKIKGYKVIDMIAAKTKEKKINESSVNLLAITAEILNGGK